MNSILIIANSTHGGGAENSMMKLHRAFLKNGFECNYISLNLMDDGLDAEDKNVLQIGRRWSDGLFATMASLRNFREIVSAVKYDVVIVNCELPELFVSFSKIKSSKLIIVEHTSKPWDGRRALGAVIRLLLKIRRAKWVTVNSIESKIWPFGDHALYIPNPVAPSRREGALALKDSVVFVGRLRAEKCPEMAIKASLECSMNISVYGDGILSADLKTRYGQSMQVKFHGYVENPWNQISVQSLVVVPSEYEGDGLVVLEALQNGNPVLLRDIQDLRRFNLSDANYFKDEADLIEKLNQFRKNHTIFNVSKSEQDRILAPRKIDNILNQWIAVINNLVEGVR